MKNPSLAGAGMALAAAALWGTTGTAQSFAPAQTSPYWVGALRLVFAGVFLSLFAWWTSRGRSLEGHEALAHAKPWRRIVFAGLCVACYNLAFFAGIKATGVAVGTAIAIGSGPVWAGVMQSLISRKTPNGIWWMGTLLAVAGGAAMVLGRGEGLSIDAAGLALCLLSGLAYSSYTLVNQTLVREMSPVAATAWVFALAAVIAVPAAQLAGGRFSSSLSGWVVAGYLGLVPTGIAYLLFSHALRHVSGATGVTLALAEPVTAFVLAVLVVHEQPAAMAFMGLALVVAGLALVIWMESRAAAPVVSRKHNEEAAVSH